jgi:hypothetical protein
MKRRLGGPYEFQPLWGHTDSRSTRPYTGTILLSYPGSLGHKVYSIYSGFYINTIKSAMTYPELGFFIQATKREAEM